MLQHIELWKVKIALASANTWQRSLWKRTMVKTTASIG